MTYARPFQKFGEFVLVSIIAAATFVWAWDKGWWQVLAWVFVWTALDCGRDWLKEVDKARYGKPRK